MAKNFNELFSKLRENGMKKVSVAVAQDEPVLEAVREAKELGIAEAVLVGNEEKIKEIAKKIGMNLADFEIINEPNDCYFFKKCLK